MKKRTLALLLSGCTALTLFAGCGSDKNTDTQDTTEKKEETEKEAEPVELTVFAAASMTETLTKLGDMYMKEHENVSIVFNFDSSGTLKTQIQEGAPCDIFISAGQKQMNQLDINAKPEVNT